MIVTESNFTVSLMNVAASNFPAMRNPSPATFYVNRNQGKRQIFDKDSASKWSRF